MLGTLLGLTRSQLKERMGEPDAFAMTNRKQRQYNLPCIYKYGGIEYWFQQWRDGVCICVFDSETHTVVEKL